MTMANHPAELASSLSTSRKIRCAVYGVIAVVGYFATWGPVFLGYTLHEYMFNFMTDIRVLPASRAYTGDLSVLGIAVVILMVVEARRHSIRFVWLYIVGGFLTALSSTFPLFLIAREFRLADTPTPRLRIADKVGLAIISAALLTQIVWINLV
ncbi:hypothetical protein A5645_04295 [Mycobacterium asiaticum]|uniref:DUF2834 domain-containing protein n=1 Tax=Mycobacterium asiaticum TaxID=1790 RepID=UPI0007F0232B|nr:DUF2834 domain-containing protein [Mycobacterium asiaticum]OBK98165.1 hypothetical protein A5645_04295 [Mycobacterium asiaticum]